VDRIEDALRVERDLPQLLERGLDIVGDEVSARGAVGETTHGSTHSVPLCALPRGELVLAVHAFDGPATDRARPTEFR
jgi:hypothetical protein